MSFGTIIIGNGVAGITTARHLRKNSDQRIQVVSSETPYFFSRTALMYVYMGHMEFKHIQPYENNFWEKNRIELIQARVERVDANEKKLHLSNGEALAYDNLVIATGSKSRYFGWPGQNLKGVQGLFSYQDLQTLEANTPKPFEKGHACKKAVIVGAGLIGVELAEMLRTRNIEVTMLVRDSYFWGNVITENEGAQINKHIEHHGVKLMFQTELESILPDDEGRVRAIKTTSGEEIECQVVGVTTGVEPNISFLEDAGLEVNRGILVDDFLQTNIPDVYAAGDCAELRRPKEGRRALEPVWYVGRMMGEVLGHTLAGAKTAYSPGPWFNSAKFFDIEYQTYGMVKAKPDENHAHYFWKHPSEDRFITIAYHPQTLVFQGVNSFGIRLRHIYFDRLLRKGKRVGEVVGGIKAANFDAEFYGKWHKALQADFTSNTGIALKKSNLLKSLLST